MKPLILLEQGLNENSGVCYLLCVSNETCVCVCVCAGECYQSENLRGDYQLEIGFVLNC